MNKAPLSTLAPAVWVAFALSALHLPAQGTAFTYQGLLAAAGAPANGSYDLKLTLFDAVTNGNIIAGPVTNAAVAVSNGLFTTLMDFGPAFDGNPCWLRIQVRTNGASGFALLSPRQPVTPSPYAEFATTASNLSGAISFAQLPASVVTNNENSLTLKGTFSGNGAGLTNLSAATLDGLSSGGFWQVGGNTGANPTNRAFLGTRDNLPLEFWVNTNRALRLEYADDDSYGGAGLSPNVIGGSGANVVSNGYVGAFIGGGGLVADPNLVGGSYASILGGVGNSASGYYSTAMGTDNTASGVTSTAMGDQTIASGMLAMAMGAHTGASGDYSMAMGFESVASGEYSVAMGHLAAALDTGDFVWADSQYGNFSATAADQFLIRARGGVGINLNNTAGDSLSIGGTLRMNNNNILFRASPDPNHGVGYYGQGTSFAGVQPDGPVLFGFAGGCLGTEQNGSEFVALQWTTSGVSVNGTFNNNSDRNAKQDFAPISAAEVLRKVSRLPLSQWSYKTDANTRHIGPMAQDFYAAFNVGTDEKHIAPIDEGGVALAAIQGLNQKLDEQKAENAALKQQLAQLRDLVEQLARRPSSPPPAP